MAQKGNRTGFSLRQQLEALTIAADQSGLSIVVIDKRTTIRYANEAFTRSIAHSKDDVLGRPLGDFLRNGDDAKALDLKGLLKSKKKNIRVSLDFLRKDGRPVKADMTLDPLAGDARSAAYFALSGTGAANASFLRRPSRRRRSALCPRSPMRQRRALGLGPQERQGVHLSAVEGHAGVRRR